LAFTFTSNSELRSVWIMAWEGLVSDLKIQFYGIT